MIYILLGFIIGFLIPNYLTYYHPGLFGASLPDKLTWKQQAYAFSSEQFKNRLKNIAELMHGCDPINVGKYTVEIIVVSGTGDNPRQEIVAIDVHLRRGLYMLFSEEYRILVADHTDFQHISLAGIVASEKVEKFLMERMEERNMRREVV